MVGLEALMFAGDAEGGVVVESPFVISARSWRTASAASSPQLAPVMSKRSAIRWRRSLHGARWRSVRSA